MAIGEYRLQFLHISDLHAKGSREKESWRRRRVLGDSWLRNLERLLGEEGLIHFVFFTGDAAYSGKPEEFAEVTSFFHDLCEQLCIGFERLFVVPGNHDIDRRVQPKTWELMRMHLASSSNLLGVSRWMTEIGPPPLGFEDTWKQQILERQKAYRSWATSELQHPEFDTRNLGYRCSVQLPG